MLHLRRKLELATRYRSFNNEDLESETVLRKAEECKASK